MRPVRAENIIPIVHTYVTLETYCIPSISEHSPNLPLADSNHLFIMTRNLKYVLNTRIPLERDRLYRTSFCNLIERTKKTSMFLTRGFSSTHLIHVQLVNYNPW